MASKYSASVGRPKLSSKQTLEDAAAELFLEQTYNGTTIDQVARRAGVSRNTFFNYFDSKADLLWVDVDNALDDLESRVGEAAPARGFPANIDAVCSALAEVASAHPHGRVPVGFTQRELMGTTAELHASGLVRMSRAILLVERAVGRPPGVDPLVVRSFAAAVVAAAAAGAMQWASAGVARGQLADDIERAIRPVCNGFSAAAGVSEPPQGRLD